MKIIGLCGTSGSGKGMAGRFFSAFGCRVIDTDKLYHGMIESDSECSREIISEFGETVKNESGGVERKKLSQIVFSDKERLEALNRIAHKYVKLVCLEIAERERRSGTEILIIDAPQLFEAGMQEDCDATVAVIAERETRIERICNRDRISAERAIARIEAQHTDEFFSEHCDYVIENNSDAAHLLARVRNVLDKIKGMN